MAERKRMNSTSLRDWIKKGKVLGKEEIIPTALGIV
jgi:hypothetical protein